MLLFYSDVTMMTGVKKF